MSVFVYNIVGWLHTITPITYLSISLFKILFMVNILCKLVLLLLKIHILFKVSLYINKASKPVLKIPWKIPHPNEIDATYLYKNEVLNAVVPPPPNKQKYFKRCGSLEIISESLLFKNEGLTWPLWFPNSLLSVILIRFRRNRQVGGITRHESQTTRVQNEHKEGFGPKLRKTN